MRVAAFKKGPDYIDAAWLKFASGSLVYNLDSYLMGASGVSDSFLRRSRNAEISVIEGNRGLFDGFDANGTHSSAELAKLLRCPVILVQDVTKVTRTAAATVLGCKKLDPEVQIAGVILNRVANPRHEEIIRRAIEESAGVPVVGAIPKLSSDEILPGRHLGLVTPVEHPKIAGLLEKITAIIEQHVDCDQIFKIAASAPELTSESAPESISLRTKVKPEIRIAYFSDSAFTFYYPENLEALENAGAELIPVSSLTAEKLPNCQGLYIGGGFPETHADKLSANQPLRESVKNRALQGLPIFAECGGLIYLSKSIEINHHIYPMSDVFPLELSMQSKPQGHGYMEVIVDKKNPLFTEGTTLLGHEFHYSRVHTGGEQVETIYQVNRGVGCFDQRDGLIERNVIASYLHIHALSAPQWAPNFVQMCRQYQPGREER